MSAEHSEFRRTATPLPATECGDAPAPSGTDRTLSPDVAPGTPARPLPPLHYGSLAFHAKGNLGEVLRARDEVIGREVALKRMQAHRADHPDSRRRFLREAEVTGRLEHPGVVPVYGLGHDEHGRPCYAMRFVQGQTFKDAIDGYHQGTPADPGERRLVLRQLLASFVAVCKTVAYAHSRGIIHRDLKPANIMLGKYGETLVVDWGLAKAVDRDDAARAHGEETLEPTLEGNVGATQLGQIVGTPAYCSPEQAAGLWDVVGPASDVFSLGAVLYNLLTGRLPYAGSSVLEILAQASMGEIVPPRQRQGDVPRTLEAVCLKAMAKERGQRYGSALELAADVEHWLADEPVSAYREGRAARLGRWGRRHRALVAATMALLLTAVAGLGLGLVAVNQERQHTADAREDEARARADEARRRQQAREALDAMSAQVIDELLGKQKELSPEHKAFLKKALKYYEEFARDTGRDEQSRAGVAAASHRVGSIDDRLGQHAEAEAAYQRSADLYERLAADFPDRPDYRFALAKCHGNLSNLLKDTGRLRDAEAAYKETLALQKQLAADFPDRPDYRRDVARSHNNLGNLLKDTGRPRDAEAAYKEALALKKQLAADFPDRPDYRQELATGHLNLGVLLKNTGRPRDAEAAYRDALALHKRLAVDFPDWPDYRQDLARSHNNLGNLLRSTGRVPEAEAAFQDALGLYKQLAADFPIRPDYRRELALSHNNQGRLLAAIGRPRDAEAAYQEALALQKRLAADFPDRPDSQAELANTLAGLAELAHAQKRPAEACRLLTEAQPHIQAALRANPRHPFFRPVAAANRQALAQARLGLGEHAAAAAAAEEMLPLGAAPATDAYNAACVLAQCVPLAEKDATLSDGQRPEQAGRYAERAVALLRRAVAVGFKDAEHMKKDTDLAALRSRPDFQKLLAELANQK